MNVLQFPKGSYTDKFTYSVVLIYLYQHLLKSELETNTKSTTVLWTGHNVGERMYQVYKLLVLVTCLKIKYF